MKARQLMLLVMLAIVLPGPCMAAAGDIDEFIGQVRREASQELRYGKEREQRFLEEQQKRQALLRQTRKERDALATWNLRRRLSATPSRQASPVQKSRAGSTSSSIA